MGLASLLFAWFYHPGQVRSLSVGGRKRTYCVHIPQGHDPKRPVPVVLALHGATMNGPMMAWFCGLNQKADEVGFVAVYPNGTGSFSSLTWNGGNCCGSAMQQMVDDVAFIDALLDDLAQVVPVETRRIYVTGISNGAILAYRLASELSERIAAIAPVAGPMGTETCTPKRPVSVIHFHGTDDQLAPFQGGRAARSVTGTDFYSVDHSIRAWVKANGCREVPTIEEFPDRANDGTRVIRQTYGGGKDGAEVVLVTIEGGGHTWPGRPVPAKLLGKTTGNVSASDLMWEFFEKHGSTAHEGRDRES